MTQLKSKLILKSVYCVDSPRSDKQFNIIFGENKHVAAGGGGGDGVQWQFNSAFSIIVCSVPSVNSTLLLEFQVKVNGV